MPELRTYDYDLLVIGSGPGGQKAAIAAAKLGRRVAIVDRAGSVGGVSAHTGTLPSKTLREAALYLSGLDQREVYGQSYRLKDDVTVQDLAARVLPVLTREVDTIKSQLQRNHVTMITGTARFVDPTTVEIVDGVHPRLATAEKVVIAVGTRPARPPGVLFDGQTVLDTDTVIGRQRLPRSIVVVGAGVIGIEYASIFAALGVRVTVVDQRDRMLEFCDAEIVEALQYCLRGLNVTFRFSETVESVEPVESADGETHAVTSLLSGKRIVSDVVLYSAGR